MCLSILFFIHMLHAPVNRAGHRGAFCGQVEGSSHWESEPSSTAAWWRPAPWTQDAVATRAAPCHCCSLNKGDGHNVV